MSEENTAEVILFWAGCFFDKEMFVSPHSMVEGSRIKAVGPDLPEDTINTIDAAGCYVTPGLVDHHAHVWPLANIGLPAASSRRPRQAPSIVTGSTRLWLTRNSRSSTEYTRTDRRGFHGISRRLPFFNEYGSLEDCVRIRVFRGYRNIVNTSNTHIERG
ncbi:hypothetical protein ACTQ56_12300 [[Clostridium] aminophilum]|uniref:hypothetical protein n=1 Tax=[Clostridium] aminophilum TaxID=1526 RepID=UPI003F949082